MAVSPIIKGQVKAIQSDSEPSQNYVAKLSHSSEVGACEAEAVREALRGSYESVGAPRRRGAEEAGRTEPRTHVRSETRARKEPGLAALAQRSPRQSAEVRWFLVRFRVAGFWRRYP